MTTTTAKTIATKIHEYRFDVSNPEGQKAYQALQEKMKEQGTECFETIGQGSHYNPALDGITIHLETAFIFDNQWNTAPIQGVTDKGLRVFDWAQDYLQVRNIKQGHYLEMTSEMIEVRSNRMKCGYCGKQYDKRENPPPLTFCHECLGNQYLKPDQLKLVRIEPVCNQTFTPLTDEESAYLLPIYQAEQAGKGSERARKAREQYGKRIKEQYREQVEKAETKYQGLQWLFDHGCSLRILENCIYYDHTKVFRFGWREKLDAGGDLDWLLSNLSEFPFDYNIDTVHRGKIGGKE